MTERDYAEETLTVAHAGVFDFEVLYLQLKKWFKQYKYKLLELEYKDRREDGIRKVLIKWQAKKKMNDYVKYAIETDLVIDNFEEVMANKRKRAKGDLKISFAAHLEKDYEETWYRSSFSKFIGEVYDKFAQGAQFAAMEKELKRDMHALVIEIKTYLNLIKLRS